ncbi:MAG: putative ABC-type transport system involved in lysophospholipase L1 biosynthesis ATPase subunit [Candidatus Pelagisphaera sp.]
MSEFILEARSVQRSFENGDKQIDVLREVDFQLKSGQSASIQGESGSGKSTLLNLLAGLDLPDGGDVLWKGESIDGRSGDFLSVLRGSLIGMVFQSYYLVPELRALDNVMLGGRISGKVEKIEERSIELLERVGLGDRMKSLPATLSGGERQRVAIARAMISNPRILLADEPTGNLDETTGDSIMEMLQALCREDSVALVLVTHNTAYASRMDDSWHLKQGVLELSKRIG